jgi:MFS family permease
MRGNELQAVYPIDLIERLKLRAPSKPGPAGLTHVHPVIWKMGLASLLTDISSEMVNSLLPVYAVLYLHLNPLQFGAINAAYDGAAIAGFGLLGGLLADRSARHKEVAAGGYGLSTVSKLLLLWAGGAWGWITAIVALDRVGKSSRTAPRDALISFYSKSSTIAASFGVHRALDAGGALIGPVIAFILIGQLHEAYDAIWVTSFTFGVLGLAAFLLLVHNPPQTARAPASLSLLRDAGELLADRRYRTVVIAALALSVTTIADAFLFLVLQQRGGVATGLFPLFYVGANCFYMAFALPIGRAADRWGLAATLIFGYTAMAVIYCLLLSPAAGGWLVLTCLFLFGLYYAGTQGVLMALASLVLPRETRTSGLAILNSAVGIGNVISSIVFGWLWQAYGVGTGLWIFGLAFIASVLTAGICLPKATSEEIAR